MVHMGKMNLLDLFSVVRLRPRWAEPSSAGPVVESGSIGWTEASLVCRPEPTVDVLREEVGPVAAVKVTQAARGPEVGHVA